MSDLQIPKRTELEKRLADALADILILGAPFCNDESLQKEWDQAILRAHQVLRRYNAKTQAEMLS